MKELYVYCAGAFGKEVMDVARRVNAEQQCWSRIAFVDDFADEGSTVYDAEVFKLSTLAEAENKADFEIVIANGEPEARRKILELVDAAGISLGRVIDNTTIVVPTASVAGGVIITPFCSISSDATLRRNSSVNTMSIVGHDVDVGENTVLSSMVNIGGSCRIGANTYIGMGAKIRDEVTIGENTIISMGAVVYKDIPDGVIAMGNPARPMRENTDKKIF